MRLVLFFAVSISFCYGQESVNRAMKVGIYGFGLPNRFYGGVIADLALFKNDKLYSSSSINYRSALYASPKYQFVVASGLSYVLTKNKFSLHPGIQIGYLNTTHLNHHSFNGGCGRLSIELTYAHGRFEYGFLISQVFGYGWIKETHLPYDRYVFYIPNTVGGIELKYNFRR
jgi:hypothetical protein